MSGTSTVRQEHDLWKYELRDPSSTGGADGRELALTLYPNPVMGDRIQMLRLPEGFEDASVRLLGADGRRIGTLQNDGVALQLPQGLSTGKYFLTFSAPSGIVSRSITVMR